MLPIIFSLMRAEQLVTIVAKIVEYLLLAGTPAVTGPIINDISAKV